MSDEFLDAMEHLWYDERPAYHGRFVDFAGVDAHPRPAQRPLPIVIGGHSAPAYRRAVLRGHGWYGYALSPEQAATSLAGLREAANQVERSAALGRLEVTVTPRGPLTAESASAFAELGVDRLVVSPPMAEEAQATIDGAAEAVADLP